MQTLLEVRKWMLPLRTAPVRIGRLHLAQWCLLLQPTLYMHGHCPTLMPLSSLLCKVIAGKTANAAFWIPQRLQREVHLHAGFLQGNAVALPRCCKQVLARTFQASVSRAPAPCSAFGFSAVITNRSRPRNAVSLSWLLPRFLIGVSDACWRR